MIQAGLRSALFGALDVLEALHLKYALVGGLAVSAWGEPRATRDADLWVDLRTRHRELEAALRHGGFDVPAMEQELGQFGVFRSKHLASGVFVDMFDAVGPLGEAILRRRKHAIIAERTVWLASAEDVAVLKAFSDRARDLDDLVVLLRVTALNKEYVARWAKELDASLGTDEVSERLALAIARAKFGM